MLGEGGTEEGKGYQKKERKFRKANHCRICHREEKTSESYDESSSTEGYEKEGVLITRNSPLKESGKEREKQDCLGRTEGGKSGNMGERGVHRKLEST